jgi:hypothetical protein
MGLGRFLLYYLSLRPLLSAFSFPGDTNIAAVYGCAVREPVIVYSHSVYAPFIHPLYTFITIFAPMYTRHSCIYNHLYLTHLYTPHIHAL